MKAVISYEPMNRLYGLPEVVETIEITHCLQMLKLLSDLADYVNANPSQFCDTAQMMADSIIIIRALVTLPSGLWEEF